jgi:branched-chain amino acid transport system ATP-binding protein
MLDVSNLYSGYGKLTVLRDVSLSVKEREILLIVGENGAGKSTLLRTIAGFIKPTAGSIKFKGTEISGGTPEQAARAGLRLVLDGHRVFPELTVYDNLRLGATLQPDRQAFAQAVEEIFDVFPILKERRNQPARDLSGGQQQMLALGQAFVARPKVLLCDEPSTGLAQMLLPPILQFLKRWADSGTAIVIVEQHVQIALPVASRALWLDRGAVAFEGTPQALADRLGFTQDA